MSEPTQWTGSSPRPRPEHLALVTVPDTGDAGDAYDPDEPGVTAAAGRGQRPRRTFSAEYKLAIVEEYESCLGDGDKGDLLRREGLSSTHVLEWRRARDAAFARAGLLPSRPREQSPEATALAAAQRRIERLERELARARLVIEIQGRAHTLLEMVADSAELPLPG